MGKSEREANKEKAARCIGEHMEEVGQEGEQKQGKKHVSGRRGGAVEYCQAGGRFPVQSWDRKLVVFLL